MDFIKVTEQDSNHNHLEKKSVKELVESMHEEDNNALNAVQKVLPEITKLIEEIAPKMKNEQIVVMNMCGRGDKDIFTVAKALNIKI